MVEKNYYPCLACKTLFHRDQIVEKGFVVFNHLQFICPICKETLKEALKEKEE